MTAEQKQQIDSKLEELKKVASEYYTLLPEDDESFEALIVIATRHDTDDTTIRRIRCCNRAFEKKVIIDIGKKILSENQ